MKSLMPLAFVLLIIAGCVKKEIVAKRVGSINSTGQTQELPSATPMPSSEVAKALKEAEEKEAMLAFADIDFDNFSYPTNLRGNVMLKDGTRTFENPEGGGGDTFELRGVNYADVTGNGKYEAVVHLTVLSCGGSCDGGSHLFYFYSPAKNKPLLLSRIETGSLSAPECGLKSFVLEKEKLTLELFRICRPRGLSFQSVPDARDEDNGGKFAAHSFTRFVYRFEGNRFVQSSRDVFPFEPGDVRNFGETISVN